MVVRTLEDEDVETVLLAQWGNHHQSAFHSPSQEDEKLVGSYLRIEDLVAQNKE